MRAPPSIWPIDEEEGYFASGCNHPGEIRGFALSGRNVGVSAARLSPAAEHELTLYAGAPLKVLIDSGAFSEVVFEGGTARVTRLISSAEWTRRLAIYERLARALGPQLHCIAPDRVGSQTLTLVRLADHAGVIRRLRDLGAHVIVPLQNGARRLVTFREAAARAIGFDDFICGIPMKKRATSLEDIAELAGDLFRLARPTRVHLLGCGPRSVIYRRAEAEVRLRSPWTRVTSDSVRITAMVGRNERRADGTLVRRPLTAALDAISVDGRWTNTADRKANALTRVLQQETRVQLARARKLGWFDEELESAQGLMISGPSIDAVIGDF